MSPKNPDWLPEVRDFCRRSSLTISGWGPDTIIVEAKSPDQTAQASSLLRQFGFEPMLNASAPLVTDSPACCVIASAPSSPSATSKQHKGSGQQVGAGKQRRRAQAISKMSRL
jgi:hypothetical protein